MKQKYMCYSESAYILGIVILACGTALMVQANFGISMVVVPAYLLHLWISRSFPGFSFGMAEFVVQAILLIILSAVMKKGKLNYLFSFVTAVFYGLVLDLATAIIGLLPCEGLAGRLAWYAGGLLLCAIGISFLFHTYISPEAYELFVKEISAKFGWSIPRVKTIYDCCSCLLGIILSFLLFGFGHFEGVKLGTVFCALINGWLIGQINKILDRLFQWKDALPLRKWFG